MLDTDRPGSKRKPQREPIQREQRKKSRNNMISMIIALLFISAVLLMAGVSLLIKKYTPTKERVDGNNYYNIQAEDDMAIILDNQRSEYMAKYWDGHVYLNYDLVHGMLNQRFFWDNNENILRYVTPTDVISVNAGATDYMVTKTTKTEDYVIVKVDGNQVYLALDFVQAYTNIDFKVWDTPNRVQITSVWNTIDTAQVKKDTQIREKGGIKSKIVADAHKETKVTVLEPGDVWSKVCTQEGMIGYMKNKTLGSRGKQELSRKFEEPVFQHLLKDKPISMAWHQVTSQEANNRLTTVLQSTKGINVLSPTWFYLNDNKGNIYSLASRSYVDYCHQNGIEVWALLSNLENPDVDSTYVLTHTSSRDYLTNQIIAAAIEYDLDGINLDFEALSGEIGDAYIQFIRELSIKCENNNIVLSVDNYVPSSYTAFYNRSEQALFADYVVVMAYDEHTKVSTDIGPVASIGFVRDGIANTVKEVPANQVIMGIPFYSRIWELTAKEDAGETADSAEEGYLPYTFTCVEEGMQTVENRFTANGAQKVWDDVAGQNYVEYVNGGKTYKIWLEDEAAVEEKLKVFKENSIAGVAYWKLGLERPTAWDTIIKYIN
ncbi:MAG: glycosyl hydrolase family 18 protein [Lachnospiraceae bacterium]